MLDMLWYVLKLRNTIDVILMDTYSTSSFWYAFLVSQLARILKLRYVPLLHGGNLPQRLKNNPKLCSLLFGNAAINVAPSRYLLHHFMVSGFSNTVFIPNTLEIVNYTFKEREAIVPHLLWVRAFAEIYNPSMAVEVLRKLKTQFPDATLCMVGPDKDGSLVTTKALAEAYGLEIQFTGKLSKKEWISLSSDYSIFINTTNFDNTPVSVMEAMALGLPVVSTNVGGIPYLLEDGVDALLVEANSVSQMVTAVERLCSDPHLATSITRTARTKVEAFDWTNVRNAWKNVI